MPKNYVKRLAEGTTIVLLFSIIGALLGYGLRVILTKILSIQDFGFFFSIMAFTGLFSIFRELGLSQALVKYLPEFRYKKEYGKIKASILLNIYIQLALTLIIFLPIIFFADDISKLYFNNPAIATPLKIISISSILSILMVAVRPVFQGFEKMIEYSIIEPVRLVIVITLILLFPFSGLIDVSIAYLISAGLVSLISFILLLRIIPLIKIKSAKFSDVSKLLFSFAIPTMITGIGYAILNYMDTLMLLYFRNPTEVGLYQVALPTSQWLLYFMTAFTIVLFPVISELWAKKQKETLSSSLSMMVKLSFVFLIPLSLIFIAFPEIILRMLFTETYVSAAHALQLLAIGTIFYSLASIFMVFINATGKPKLNTYTILIAAILNVFMNLILIPVYGATGTAFATAATFFFMLAASAYFLRRNMPYSIPLFDISKTLFIGITTLLFIFIIKGMLNIDAWLEAFVVLSISLVIYITLTIKMKIIRQAEMDVIKKAGIPVPEILEKIILKD
ncbi:MAG: oligosaccharide flippase family protein [Candidatus Aenigmarchaeota archaeon]|nr:oligosaccharide flippase family protein [Candidatus Aenigmarchaeota archaeon]